MNTTTTKIAGEAAMTDEQIDDIADDVVGPGTRLSYAQARAFARALLASKPAVPEGWKPELLYGPCQNVCWTQDMVPREERIDAVVISHSDYERLLVAPTAPAQSCGDAEQADEFDKWAAASEEERAPGSAKRLDAIRWRAKSASRHLAAEQADEAATDDVFDWLETEVTAISCRYHGDPSYDHDAYWMRDRVVKLIGEARNTFAARAKDSK